MSDDTSQIYFVHDLLAEISHKSVKYSDLSVVLLISLIDIIVICPPSPFINSDLVNGSVVRFKPVANGFTLISLVI